MVTLVGDGTVRIGSWVRVRDGQLEEGWWIVPPGEADAMDRHISEACPLARALLGHQVGDQIGVQGPEGRFPVTILDVR